MATEKRENCKAKGWHGRMGSLPCSRRATRDGYCAQHHPEAEAARARKRSEKLHMSMRLVDARSAVESAERKVLSQIRRGAGTLGEMSRILARADARLAKLVKLAKES